MMKNKYVSKITMLTCLMLAGVVNAQEFYTCVPKKSWWMDTMGESIKRNVPSANDIAKAIHNPELKLSKWEFVRTIEKGKAYFLTIGQYKLESVLGFECSFFDVTVPSKLIIDSENNIYNMGKKVAHLYSFFTLCNNLYVLK